MSAAAGEMPDPDDLWMLVLDVPADADLTQKSATVDALRDTAETLSGYAAEQDTVDAEEQVWTTAAYDEQLPMADVAAEDRDYVADRMQNALDMHGYDSVRLVYQQR